MLLGTARLLAKVYGQVLMETAALLTTFLSPFLPHLLKLGKPVVEEAGKKVGVELGESSWEVAKRIWIRVFPKVQEKPLAEGAAAAVAEDEKDEDAKSVLIRQFEKILSVDPELTQFVQNMLADNAESVNKAIAITQTVSGNKNIVIGNTSGTASIVQS